ncbi:EpsG family protein [Fusobacterium animalis]|nr:EpsG family protein [Fusobacterium nucleatum]
MSYYLTLFLVLFYHSIKYEFMYKEKRNWKRFIVFVVIFLLAFSYQMGTDWLNYQYFYDYDVPNIKLNNLFSNFQFMFSSEKGFVLLNILFYNLGFNYELFTGIVIGSCLFLILNFIEKKSDNFYFSFFLSIVMFLFGYSLEPVLRQLIALTLIITGFKYIEKRCFFKYLLIIILAVQFHLSAFIAIFFYFLEKIKLNKKRAFLIFIGIYILILFLFNIFLELSHIFPKLLKYEYYFFSSYYGLARSRTILGELYHIIIIVIYGYIIFYSYNFSPRKKNYIKNMALFYIIIYYFNNMIPILYRVSDYFVVGFIISLASLKFIRLPNGKIIKLKKRPIGCIIIIIFYFLFLLYFWKESYSTKLNRYRYGEYKNYFIEMINGTLKKDFYEKSEEYKKNIEILLNEEREK